MEDRPIAMTIAGSDSGGGAGIQADLKTFNALGVHGTTVITAVTAQNPKAVTAISPVPAELIQAQIQALFAELAPKAIKTGMLFSVEAIEVVVDSLVAHADIPLVVDPVFVATSGAPLLQRDAIEALRKKLLPKARLITPNVPEAQALLGRKLQAAAELQVAARQLSQMFGCQTLLKGGHLPQQDSVIDIYDNGKETVSLSSKFIPDVVTHGTGCTMAAAVTAALALGKDVAESVDLAKRFVAKSIENGYRAGGHFTLAQAV